VNFESGTTLSSKYLLLDRLGAGGMGEVFKARDGETGRDVVVKIPYAHLLGDPATYSRYEREVEIGRRLKHPNIQRMLDEGRVDGGVAPYVVLEYVEGEPLREFLDERGPRPPEEAVRLTLQLTDALTYCHKHGIIHRDLKPENVLIAPDGHLKLVDFGIALLRGARRLTFRRLSSEVGTPDYMAPEQVQGDRGDARTDVYAVGVMLYEMLAGEVPYQGDSPLSVMSQHVTTDAPLLRSKCKDVPPPLEAVVYRALQRDPADRYPTMEALQHDLEHLDEVTIPEYAVGAAPGAIRPHARTAALLLGVFAVLALIGIGAELLYRVRMGG